MFNFIESCLKGEVLVQDIDSYIDSWHDMPDESQTLREYLGMSKTEYILWMRNPSNIHFIIQARQRGIDVQTAIDEFNTMPMAARGSSKGEIKTILQWLNNNGFIDYQTRN